MHGGVSGDQQGHQQEGGQAKADEAGGAPDAAELLVRISGDLHGGGAGQRLAQGYPSIERGRIQPAFLFDGRLAHMGHY